MCIFIFSFLQLEQIQNHIIHYTIMKNTNRQNNFAMYRPRHVSDNDVLKNGYGSLDNYTRNPYLQRLNIHSNFKKNKHESSSNEKITKNTLKSLQNNIYKISHLKTKEQSLNMSTSSKDDIQQGYNSKKITKLKLPKISLQENKQISMTKHKITKKAQINPFSATLQINVKKRKLKPLRSEGQELIATRTKAGTNGKQTKINQDIIITNNKLPYGLKLYCVCDGHGVNGHLVSAFIKADLIKNLTSQLKRSLHQPENIQQIISIAFRKTNHNLLQSKINTELSGSTVVAIFIHRQHIMCFNVGDSRAILASYGENDKKWNIKSLSQDQKPSRQDQKQRIIKAGGRIQCQKDQKGQDIGPLRVWMKEIHMPGLAMTRSFGDKAGMKAGTNGEPEITFHQISPNDKFLVIASDGVWQYLENQEVVNILTPFYLKNQLQQGAQRLMKITVEIWQNISFSRDDISFIILALHEINS